MVEMSEYNNIYKELSSDRDTGLSQCYFNMMSQDSVS